jgi:signal transduction histidine kinase
VPDSQVSSASASPASQGKSLPEVLLRQKLLNAFPVMAMVLDGERRVVFSNQALLDFVGAAEVEGVRGLRPGAVLGCVHADEPPDGCTTTDRCAVCGGRGAIASAEIGRAAGEPYRLRRRTAHGEEALDLYVWSTPIDWEGQRCTVVCAMDVGDKLRRHALERSLFQGAFRLVEGLQTLAGALERSQTPGQQQAIVHAIAALTGELREALQKHSDLAAAERGDLEVRKAPVGSLTLLESLVKHHAAHSAAPHRSLLVDPGAAEVVFHSDPVLVLRVVGHMIENAVEASAPGETVTVACRRVDASVEFSVHNPGEMPREVQLQVFQRSFSTKGPGRGLGTYMMRLLSERYLGGRVGFRSDPETGTVFTAGYPLEAGKE